MEVENEEYRREGFFFGTDSFRLDLYRLVCIFLASPDFARLRGRESTNKVADLDDEFSEFEIMRLLVDIAVKARMVHDRDKKFFHRVRAECGYLIPDLNKPRHKYALTLREACNKVIHAKKFNFDVKYIRVKDRDFKDWGSALRPYVYLYGEQDNVSWKAMLDIILFAKRNMVFVKG
jgi:hypothetical protein